MNSQQAIGDTTRFKQTNKSIGANKNTELSREASKLVGPLISELLSTPPVPESDTFRFQINKIILAYLQQGNLTSTRILTPIAMSTQDLTNTLLEDLSINQINDESLSHSINTFATALYGAIAYPSMYAKLPGISQGLIKQRAVVVFEEFYKKIIKVFTDICEQFVSNFNPVHFRGKFVDGMMLIEIKKLMRHNINDLIMTMEARRIYSVNLLNSAFDVYEA